MPAPRVSIVIPAYNAEATLAETLASVEAQTCAVWEAIIVDDGSTDRTAGIAAEFASRDDRFRVVQQANLGEAGARNTGLAVANGEWFVFLDADDWILPAYLERMTQAAEELPAPDVVHCGWLRVTPDGHESQGIFAPQQQEMFPVLARRNCFAGLACLVRRSLIESVGPFDVTLKTCADWDLWQRIARTGPRFGWVSEALACYRMRPLSAGTAAAQVLADGLKIIERASGPDPRVTTPAPLYANGTGTDLAAQARWEQLGWAAGLAIGQEQSVDALVDLVGNTRAIVSAEVLAHSLFVAVPTPGGQFAVGWVSLWPRVEPGLNAFLETVETRSGSPGLASACKSLLMRQVLASALPEFLTQHAAFADSLLEASSTPEANWKLLACERAREISELQRWVVELERVRDWLEAERQAWMQKAGELERGTDWLEAQRHAWMEKVGELERGTAWLEAQRQAWMDKVGELERGTAWLEGQRQAWMQRAGELEHGTDWLDGQRQVWMQRVGELERAREQHDADHQAWLQKAMALERQLRERKTPLGALQATARTVWRRLYEPLHRRALARRSAWYFALAERMKRALTSR